MNNSIRGYKIIYLKKVLFTSIKCTVALCASGPRRQETCALDSFTNTSDMCTAFVIRVPLSTLTVNNL